MNVTIRTLATQFGSGVAAFDVPHVVGAVVAVARCLPKPGGGAVTPRTSSAVTMTVRIAFTRGPYAAAEQARPRVAGPGASKVMSCRACIRHTPTGTT